MPTPANQHPWKQPTHSLAEGRASEGDTETQPVTSNSSSLPQLQPESNFFAHLRSESMVGEEDHNERVKETAELQVGQ